MREIATALGMSHQRVHQIIGTEGIVEVEPSAVTDVSPLPSAVIPSTAAVAVTAGEDACSFCGAPRRELDKLFAAPGPVFICDGCVGRANLAVQSREAKGFRTVPVDEDATCSFCGNASAVGGVMAEAESGSPRICARCTETCRKLVTKEEPAKTMSRRSSKVRCSFCNVSQADTKKLIAGPGVYICEGCVAAAGDVVATATPAKGPRQVVLRPAITEDHECSFCGKPPTQVEQLAKGGRARICDECVQLCCDIVEEAG
jgi:ATP-dependent protease Clp ATPase subunit